ncbi:acidic tetraheme cytochrome c3 TmcA [Desulfospira joergensenii]|uniref:acidic tetraheme cytochrome c3 TmcA n=1 Tax=Desulfospira joergensenii TaxID=53329 RepID=UPI0003B45B83|nr:cytochrome c3 family protein [Desulfospira joergensenii]
MKPKIILYTLILLAAIVCTAFSVQEVERLSPDSFENPRRPGAVFAHDDHNEAAEIDDCAVCHHLYEDGKLLEDESSEDSPCSECHALSAGPENKISLANAFHKRCRDCHFDAGKGPVLCGQCHKKE